MSRLLVIQHLRRESPGLFSYIAKRRGLEVVIHHVYQGESIPKPLKGDILLILGGPMGISDLNNPKYPWLKQEIELIQETLDKEIAFLGVCLGAQMLAFGAGGSVEVMTKVDSILKSPEIGWSPVELLADLNNQSVEFNQLFPLDVLHWHGDKINLPKSATLIASSKRCNEQFFCVNSNSFGIQFHVEIELDDIHRWIIEDKEFIQSALGLKASTKLSLVSTKTPSILVLSK